MTSEQDADAVMNEIFYISVVAHHTSGTQADSMLRHLYELHKLRDWKVYQDILYFDGCMTMWPTLDEMQTF